MKKKDYKTPTTWVVQLQHTGMLMTSDAQGSTGTQNYNWNDTVEE